MGVGAGVSERGEEGEYEVEKGRSSREGFASLVALEVMEKMELKALEIELG
jgi:hypothetical protein